MVRCELTDEQLRFGSHTDLLEYAGEMAEELLALRSAQAASEEQVREAVLGVIAGLNQQGTIHAHANAIATRVAKQLAGATVGLSDDERRELVCVRDGAKRHGWFLACVVLDRLLSTKP